MLTRSRLLVTTLILASGVLLASAGAASPGTSRIYAAPADPAGDSPIVSYQVMFGGGRPTTVARYNGAPPALPAAPTTPAQQTTCDVVMYAPGKNGTTIYEDATITCTIDVHYISGIDDLFRGSGYEIGTDPESEDKTNYMSWHVTGTCASSTWAYWADIGSIQTCSYVNGCAYHGPYASSQHYYSC